MSARSKKKTKPSSVPLSESMQECLDILKFIQSRDEAEPFLKPVDWELYGLSDYPQIVTHPMDLGTVEEKLEQGKYKDPLSFASDVRLVWDNCMKYNRPDSELYSSADRLSKLFEKKFSKLRSVPALKKKGDETGNKTNEAVRGDRLKFSQMVNALTPDQLGLLVEMISNQCPSALKEDEQDDIEIEINNIDASTLHNLIAYCVSCASGTADTQVQQASAQKKQKLK